MEKCLLSGTDLVFKYSSLRFGCKGLTWIKNFVKVSYYLPKMKEEYGSG
jgi:hypothetical protein